jgi:cytochrome c biogenesis protein CcdA
MTELLNFIIIFATSIIALSVLGVIAGFSPVLYIAQVVAVSKSKNGTTYSAAIMAGVLLAIFLLILLFQTIHLETLIGLIDTTVEAVTVSVAFNLVVGLGLVFGGLHYLRRREIPKPKIIKAKQAGGTIGMVGLGFIRTFVSLTGIVATFIAGNVIADVSATIIERFVYSLIFLAATVMPFFAIIILTRKNPRRITSITDTIQSWLKRFSYHLIIGAGAIIFGSSVIVFNVMMALFY